MRRSSIELVAVTLLMFACIISMADVSKSDDTQQTETNKPDKVYVIYTLGNWATQGFVIRSPERKEFQGIPCIRGTGMTYYLKGKTIYIPVDKITEIVEFDSIREWEDSIGQYKKEFPGRK